MPQLRVIPTELLIPDPDVQLAFALEPRRVKEMRAKWNPAYLAVLSSAQGGRVPQPSALN